MKKFFDFLINDFSFFLNGACLKLVNASQITLPCNRVLEYLPFLCLKTTKILESGRTYPKTSKSSKMSETFNTCICFSGTTERHALCHNQRRLWSRCGRAVGPAATVAACSHAAAATEAAVAAAAAAVALSKEGYW